MPTFDFGDGKGPVPAHQHANPDGSIGGWVADTASVDATCYVGRDAQVFGNAQVYDNARVSGDAQVYDNARVYGNAQVFENARVSGDAEVSGSAWVSGNAQVFWKAAVYGDARVFENARVYGDARVYGSAWVYSSAWVSGNAHVSGNAQVSGDAEVSGSAWVYGSAQVYGRARVYGSAQLGDQFSVNSGDIYAGSHGNQPQLSGQAPPQPAPGVSATAVNIGGMSPAPIPIIVYPEGFVPMTTERLLGLQKGDSVWYRYCHHKVGSQWIKAEVSKVMTKSVVVRWTDPVALVASDTYLGTDSDFSDFGLPGAPNTATTVYVVGDTYYDKVNKRIMTVTESEKEVEVSSWGAGTYKIMKVAAKCGGSTVSVTVDEMKHNVRYNAKDYPKVCRCGAPMYEGFTKNDCLGGCK